MPATLDSFLTRPYKPPPSWIRKPPRKRAQEMLVAPNPDDPSPDDPADDAALRARLGKLSTTLDARTPDKVQTSSEGGDAAFGGAMGMGFRVVTELVAGVVVGGGLGYLLDRWLGTKPLFLAVFILLGMAGGFWNIVRTTLLPRGPKV